MWKRWWSPATASWPVVRFNWSARHGSSSSAATATLHEHALSGLSTIGQSISVSKNSDLHDLTGLTPVEMVEDTVKITSMAGLTTLLPAGR